jgi:uncharacterized membrane protein
MKESMKKYLILSVMVNLLLAGIIGGHFLRVGRTGPLSPQIRAALGKIPSAKSEMLEGILSELNETNKKKLAEIKERRHGIFEILTKEKFDVIAYQESTLKMNELQGELMKNIGEKIKSIAAELSQEERILLAELLREPPPLLHHSL